MRKTSGNFSLRQVDFNPKRSIHAKQANKVKRQFTKYGACLTWMLIGHDAIYVPSQNSLTIYAQSAAYPNGTQLLSFSQSFQWNVNWYGISR